MAAKYCICPKCGIKFNRNAEQAVLIGARRYGHASCYPDNFNYVEMEISAREKIREEKERLKEEKEKQKELEKIAEAQDLKNLKDYIHSLYGEEANWTLIMSQIKKFKKDNNFSYSGMEKSLRYFYEIKKNPICNAKGGIGIVPYIYKESYQYYYDLYIAQQISQNKNVLYTVKEIIIKPFKSKRKRNKMFDLGELGNEK